MESLEDTFIGENAINHFQNDYKFLQKRKDKLLASKSKRYSKTPNYRNKSFDCYKTSYLSKSIEMKLLPIKTGMIKQKGKTENLNLKYFLIFLQF